MAYIGTPPSNAFTSLLKQDFSTSATTGYTLDHAVNNANDIALFINFVRQEPTTAYSASGTTLTLTSATASSDDMYCVYLGQALQTVNPANASVGASQIVDSSIALGKLSATGTKDATTFLRGDNTFAVAGGTNTPYLHVQLSSDQNTSNASNVKVTLNSVELDSASGWDNSNYKYTIPSGQGGKYFITVQIDGFSSTGSLDFTIARLYKNGSKIAEARTFHRNNDGEVATENITVIKNLSAGDYLEVYGQCEGGGNASYFAGTSYSSTYLNLYKIIE